MEQTTQVTPQLPEPTAHAFYLDSMDALDRCGVPFLVGGGYALAHYTGVIRHTKDLDLFVRPQDFQRSIDCFAAAGYRTEITWPHFLGKGISDSAFVDVLYNSGNGLCPVDDLWFEHAESASVLGRTAPVCPPEEIIWSKGFVQDRERYDGADIAHLILARGDTFDWARLIRRFEGHERVLLAHLILYGYVYPSKKDHVPQWVIDRLVAGMELEATTNLPLCRGTYLSQGQYLFDIRNWGFIDTRLPPFGNLTPENIKSITAA